MSRTEYSVYVTEGGKRVYIGTVLRAGSDNWMASSIHDQRLYPLNTQHQAEQYIRELHRNPPPPGCDD